MFTFEPIPSLYHHLHKKLSQYHNAHIIASAVDINDGWQYFNVSDFSSKGASSLHDYNRAVADAWHAEAFTHTSKYLVSVVRLDSFLLRERIETVDYLWVDAQGNDFRVLQSLGDKIGCVKAGKCEVSFTKSLYTNVTNDWRTVAQWLQNKGFETAIIPDGAFIEADLHFRRS